MAAFNQLHYLAMALIIMKRRRRRRRNKSGKKKRVWVKKLKQSCGDIGAYYTTFLMVKSYYRISFTVSDRISSRHGNSSQANVATYNLTHALKFCENESKYCRHLVFDIFIINHLKDLYLSKINQFD